MKKILLSLVALICATVSFAQSSLLATLSHEGTVKTYYGATALKAAFAEAANGDVITLSSGTFLAIDITKAITLRGAGMLANPEKGTFPTVISGDFKINIAEDVTEKLTVEGIYHNHKINIAKGTTLKNAMFLKSHLCDFGCEDNNYPGIMKDITFIHCIVNGGRFNCSPGGTISCMNCFIQNPITNSKSVFEFKNCVIKNNIEYGFSNFDNCSFFNSLFCTYNRAGLLPKGVTCFNCVAIDSDRTYWHNGYNAYTYSGKGFFYNITNQSNTSAPESIFKTYRGAVDDLETYELTDEAAAKYLGTDGTQVGIYGGSLPFDATPSNPQILKCNVASKSTADGKLSVDITIKAAE